MLVQFNFRNYRSFKNEAVLDLSSANITEFSDHVVQIGGEKVLRTAAIYGANASGKSNVINAFKFMTYYVLSSFAFGDHIRSKNIDDDEGMTVTPFLFDKDSMDESSLFEVFFTNNDDDTVRTYQYGFEIKGREILKEWLYSKAKTAREYKTIFEREYGKITFHTKSIKKYEENIKMSLEKETLIVSLGAKLKVDIFKSIRDWFYDNEVVDYGDVFENLIRGNTLPNNFASDEEVQTQVINYFGSFDDSIKGFNVEEIKKDDGEKVYKVETYHKLSDEDKFASISLSDESAGTLKMLSIFPVLKEVFRKGSVLFIDELNARLHPLLVRNIILTFLNTEINTRNAQLVFTTHDAWQMSNHLLRRDEIWFTQKDNEGVSELYSLVEISDEYGDKIRKDENYEKNYVVGKYGAIPRLTGFNVFKDGVKDGN